MHQQSIGAASPSHTHQHVGHVPRFAQRFDDVTQAIHAALHDAQLQIVPNLFRVNPGVDLFALYLQQFDPQDRQYHNCNCCHSFLRRYGSLAVLAEDGSIEPALWAVVDGVTGILVPPVNLPSLTAAFQRLMTDADLRRTLGTNGQDWARRNCWERSAEVLFSTRTPAAMPDSAPIPAPI